MGEFGTRERVLRSDVTLEESKQIEKVLRRHNISYFERWKAHSGFLGFLPGGRHSKCDIYIHVDSYEKAKAVLEERR